MEKDTIGRDINGTMMYDSEDLMTILNISETTLTRLRKSGLLASVRIGRRMYTSADSLRNYLNGVTAKKVTE